MLFRFSTRSQLKVLIITALLQALTFLYYIFISMDTFVTKKLSDWNLRDFIPIFQRVGIDEETLFLIDDDMLTELFDKDTKFGHMKRFQNRLKELKGSLAHDDKSVDSLKSSSSIPSSPLRDRTNDQNISRNNSSSIIQSHSSQQSVNNENSQITIISNTSDDSLNSSASQISIQVIPSRKLTVVELLLSTQRGLVIRKEYETFNKMNKSLLSSLLLDYEFEYTKSYRIVRDRFDELAHQSSVYFVLRGKSPEQVHLILYFRYQKGTKTSKAIDAGVCYYDKYLNCRRHYIKINLIPKSAILAEGSNEEFGHELWCIDWDFMTQVDEPNFSEIWQALTPLIIDITKEKDKYDLTLQVLESSGKSHVAALLCLTRLLCNLIGKRKASVATKRPIGPYVAVVGDYAHEGTVEIENDTRGFEIFVVVNKIDYKIPSNKVLDAVVTCYKSFASLNIPYPAETKMAWLFLQEFIFKNIPGKPNRIAAVTNLIDSVKEKQAELDAILNADDDATVEIENLG
ncbi:hypothetical protein QAD02_007638 [Eretmocerus hayati]|uniref:Uncharacterized protein n=1 Tax=Eretmocerus hayati TaxID=131215 RepID=A0ACC2N4H7_9HYME|nr:hypothetical protein QAD02_007638 [Eretmocerus hayati]